VINQELGRLEADLAPLFEKARSRRRAPACLATLPDRACVFPLAAAARPYSVQRQLCPFGAYVYGLVLTERERKAEARVALAYAANEYPCHWGAWLALQALCPDAATAAGLGLRPVRERRRGVCGGAELPSVAR
jgi:hypothetical protein